MWNRSGTNGYPNDAAGPTRAVGKIGPRKRKIINNPKSHPPATTRTGRTTIEQGRLLLGRNVHSVATFTRPQCSLGRNVHFLGRNLSRLGRDAS
ncbi:MAG: hypothetical protein ACF787_12565, partial [Rhodopirellula sp. JB053]